MTPGLLPEPAPCPCTSFDRDGFDGRCIVCGDTEEQHDGFRGACTVMIQPNDPYDPELTARALRMVARWQPDFSGES
jgi:hypothetical protein